MKKINLILLTLISPWFLRSQVIETDTIAIDSQIVVYHYQKEVKIDPWSWDQRYGMYEWIYTGKKYIARIEYLNKKN